MAAQIFTDGVFQGIDNDGLVVPYGSLYVLDVVTNAYATTYQDSSMTITNSSPVSLSASGKAKVFLPQGTYNLTLKDASGYVIWTLNNFIVADPTIAGNDQGIVVLNSITALRSYSYDGYRAMTLGTSAASDGGCYLFYWNPTSITPDDGVTSVAVYGTSTGRWLSVNSSHTLTEKTTIADADEIAICDSASSYSNKKVKWSSLYATSTTAGTVKVRVSEANLYITTNGTNP